MRILPTVHFTHKNIVLIVLSALIIGGAFLLAEFNNKKSKKVVYSAPIQAVVDQLPSELQTLDSDNDGLKDWEEVLLGTDSKNADTDGDGSKDGAEASGGRNPLVKGPKDRVTDASTSSSAVSTSTTPLTQTEKIAREFFARYMELNKAGLAGDKSIQTEIANEVIKNGIVINRPQEFELKDIIVSTDATKEGLRRYGNDVGAVFAKYQNTGRDEAVIMNEALETENSEILKQIDPIISTYKGALAAFLKIPVPPGLTEFHLGIVNGVKLFIFVAESYRVADVDTLKAIQGAAIHPEAAELLFNSLRGVGMHLDKSGIRFTTSEAGNMFTPR